MKGKGDSKNQNHTSLSNSEELFETIFKAATLEMKREKNQAFPVAPAPLPGRWQEQRKLPDAEKGVLNPSAAVPRKPGKPKASLQGNAARVQKSPQASVVSTGAKPSTKSALRAEKKKGKRAFAPKAAVLFSLLVILAGIMLYYQGILDVRLLIGYFKTGHEEEVAQVSGPGEQRATPPEKVADLRTQPQKKKHNPETINDEPKSLWLSPTESSSSSRVKEDRFAKIETPINIEQVRSGKEGVEEKAPSVTSGDGPKVARVAANQELEPEPVQAEGSLNPVAPQIASLPPSTPKYPYSVYLGSFRAPEAVKKAMSEYVEKGLSPYWARVDLGDKGVWFRFFAGYFQTKEEAEKFIRELNIQGATPGNTRYTNLIGVYGSDKDVEWQKRALLSAGFCPYVIKRAEGKSLLYSGAFDRKDYAETERAALAEKGIRNEITER